MSLAGAAKVKSYPREPRIRPDWSKAECATYGDPDLFFAEDGDHKAQKLAMQICNGGPGIKACPIREACREYASQLRLDGIWGGTTSKKRAFMRRQHHA